MRNKTLTLLSTVIIIAALLLPGVSAASAQPVASAPSAAPAPLAAHALAAPASVIGGVNLGSLTDYLFFFANGSADANWQGATKGFVGDVAVDGLQAAERTSGSVPYAGTIYTNDSTLGAWQAIVTQNAGQASASTGQGARITNLEANLTSAFSQINALPATTGYTSVSSTSLDGMNKQNGTCETSVINVTSGFSISAQIRITGDSCDAFILRWDSDANFGNGYQGQVKFQSGGAIVPLGGLKPSNFIHVAGDINASGGGSTPASPYPQGPRLNDGLGALCTGCTDFSGGGFFTGYWLTTGDPSKGETASLSNAIFVGGWYSTTSKFSMTSGTSGVHVSPNTAPPPVDTCVVVQPSATTGKDAYIQQDKPSENKGDDKALIVATESGKLIRSVLQFSLSSLPANASVTSADMSLWVTDVKDNNVTISAHALNKAWDQNSVTWNTPWVTAGGDYDPVLSTTAFTKDVKDYSATWDVTAAAQDWVNDPTTNFGIILEAPSSTTAKNTTKFQSNDEDSNDKREWLPKLKVCYNLLTPDLQVSKTLTTPGPFYVGQEMSFDIRLTNTGQTTLDFIPLRDLYDPAILEFLGATPAPDVVADGALTWDDLASSLGALGPNEAMTVQVRFKAVEATTSTALAAGTSAQALSARKANAGAASAQQSQPVSVQAPAGTPVYDTCGYPYTSNEPRTSTVFNESYILRAFSPTNGGTATPQDTIKVWYNDEHALALGVRQVQVKTASGTTTTNYPITAMAVSPADHAVNPLVGTTALTGDQAGTDLVGRPMWPSLFITDITNDPNSKAGDWQYGGTPITPHDVFGSWKGAVRFVDNTKNPAQVEVTPDADPAKNNWNLAGGEAPPAGVDNEGFGALMRWNIGDLVNAGKLTPGHTYRIQVMIHDGDQNKEGGDSGEACTTITMAPTGSIGDRVWYDANSDKVQQPSEPGLNGVKVNLYGGVCPAGGPTGTPLQTQTTASDGNYDFVGLGAGSYCVAVDASTVPVGFALTTANEPKEVDLAALQDYNDADFGYQAQCPDGTPNLALVSGVKDQYDTFLPNRQDVACVQIGAGGKLEISKTLTTPGPFYVGQTVDFSIRVTNTGKTTITELPLQDLYDPTTLGYLGATPASDDNHDDGIIDWGDLTTSLGDLAPGNSLTVAVRFRALQATSSTTQVAASALSGVFGSTSSNACTASFNNTVYMTTSNCKCEKPTSLTVRYLGAGPTTITIGGNGAGGPFTGINTGDTFTITVTGNEPTFTATGQTAQAIHTSCSAPLYPGWTSRPAGQDKTTQGGPFEVVSFSTNGVPFVLADPSKCTLGSLGDRVIIGTTVPDNGSESGVSGVTVNLYGGNCPADPSKLTVASRIKTTTTNSNGVYTFSGLMPGEYCAAVNEDTLPTLYALSTASPLDAASNSNAVTTCDFGVDLVAAGTIGNRVFKDIDGSGLPDDGSEPGINGVTVKLYNNTCTGNPAATAITAANGEYYFVNLPAGAYCVNVDESTLPTQPGGWTLTTANEPLTVNLPAGQSHLTADFGYKPIGTASIGDRVFYDLDGSGMPDDGTEPGINGVTVNLYAGACTGGLLEDTMITTGNGDYNFTDLPAGAYCVEVDENSLPAGYTLTTGNEPMTVTVQDGENYTAADFGYRASCPAGTPNLATTKGAVDATGATLPDMASVACAEIKANPGAIGDFIWYDANYDGVQDVGEPGIANVTLDLYRNGTKYASTVTDADGGYLFAGLPPGDYSVDVTDLNHRLFDSQGAAFSHSVGNQSQPDPTPSFTLAAGEVYKGADFGYYREAASGNAIIGDTVWYDGNADGIQQPNEPGISGLTVVVLRNNAVLLSAVTDSNGHYLVEVPAGTGYTVQPTPPAGLLATMPVPAVIPTLQPGDQYLDADFGYHNDNGSPTLGQIGNLVWLDTNQNGVFDGGELPLAGVSVSLIRDTDGDGQWDGGEPIIATTTTGSVFDPAYGSNGNYLFIGLPAGRYLVHVSDTNAVLLDFSKSPLGGQTVDGTNKADPYAVYLPTAGASDLKADFGYSQNPGPNVGVIGNQVWIESVPNGVFDPLQGDFGQPGVTVDLSQNGNNIASTTTGASGDYSFVHLPAGDYQVAVADDYGVLTSYAVTVLGPQQGQDNNNQNQQPNGYGVSLPSGGYNLTADFGYLKPPVLGAIGDFVWYDANHDGVQDAGEPGIPNVRLALYLNLDGNTQMNPGVDRLVATTVTDADGGYLFPDLEPGVYFVDVVEASNPNGPLGGYKHTLGPQSSSDPTAPINLARGDVYKDADFGYYKETGTGKALVGDTVWYDDNGDGFQQPGEPGIPGVTVVIRDVNGNPIGSAVTDGNGHYLAAVPVGSGYTAAVDAAASGSVLDDLSPTTPNPVNLPPLTAGMQWLAADFGYDDAGQNLLGEVGNLVWRDVNQDGIFDGGETPLAGVSVSLIRDSNGDGAWDAGEPIIATVTTGSALDGQNGNYLFTGVPQGKYLVHVSDTNAVLIDFTKTVAVDQVSDGTSKNDPYAVNLVNAGDNHYAADFGYYQNTGTEVGVIGNQVWIEACVAGLDGLTYVANGYFDTVTGDIGQAGVTVELLQGGNVVATTTTGASGDYSFVHLPAGDYSVRVSDVHQVLRDQCKGTGNLLAPTVLGPNPGADNNNQTETQATPYAVTLPMAGYLVNLTADFGYTEGPQSSGAASYRIIKRLNTPNPVRINREVSFTLQIINTSDTAWITYLALRDVYSTTYLSYLRAEPASLDNVNDGEVNWPDLITALGAGPIPPGGSAEVVVWFKTLRDTTGLPGEQTPNTVTAYNVWGDADGPSGPLDSVIALPDKSSTAPVGVFMPTGVGMTGFDATATAEGIAVTWETAEEANIAGFNVLRKVGDGELAVINSELLFAQNAGANQGAAYSFVDADQLEGVVTYALQVVRLDGSVETAGQIDVAR